MTSFVVIRDMVKIALRFGLLAVAFLLLVQLSKYSWLTYRWDTELVLLLIAVALIGLGFVIHQYVTIRKRSHEHFDADNVDYGKFGISAREYDVLVGMSDGLSNLQIADKLFISENTVKTHVSNLLLKLDARRRTEAMVKAREKGLIP